MRKTISELLARESADWHHRGIVSAALSKSLGARYERHGSILSGLITWLGLAAVCFLGMAALAVTGLLVHSSAVVLLGATAAAFWYAGVRLAVDPANRHPVSASALVTIGLAAAYGAMTLLSFSSGSDFNAGRMFSLLIVTGLLGVATAYVYHLRWPLLLSLLCLFHAFGAWHEYVGSGVYVAHIQDPPTIAVIAALCASFGLWHQRAEEDALSRYAGFGRLYVIFGLLYLNCSLWFLTLDDPHEANVLAWVSCFSLACLAQIALGARLKDGKLTGFGVVFLGIDLYTRFFEQFWERLSIGLLLLIAGLSGFLLGWIFEKLAGKSTL